MIFLSPSRQMLGKYFKLLHDHFLPNTLENHYSLIILRFEVTASAIEVAQLVEYGQRVRWLGFNYQQGQEIFLFFTASRAALTPPSSQHIQSVLGAFYLDKAIGA
jgi:hypothetical protein